jgi:hypothetical protein
MLKLVKNNSKIRFVYKGEELFGEVITVTTTKSYYLVIAGFHSLVLHRSMFEVL